MSALPLLDYLGRVARLRLEQVLIPHALRPRHLVALALLDEIGPTTQQDLAAALRLDPSNLVGLLNELDDRSLVDRRRSTGDRRRHIVELTPRGHEVLDEIHRALEAVEDEILGSLDGRQRTTLTQLLRQIVGDANPCSIDAADLARTNT